MKSLIRNGRSEGSMILALVAASGLMVASSGAAVIQIANDSDATTVTSPNWNVVDNYSPPTNISNLIDSTGTSTGVSLTQTNPFTGFNFSGTTAPQPPASATFPGDTTGESFWGDDNDPTATWTFSGFDSAATLTFTFFASRMGVTDNREAAYVLVGATTATTYLDASDNDSQVAVVTVQPDSNGNVVLNVSKGPNNNNSSGYYYLGALTIDVVPEPSALLMTLMGALGFIGWRRRSR